MCLTTLAAALVAIQIVAAPSVSGVVRDSSGQVVPGAVIVARDASGAEQQAVTASDGRFTFAIPAAGEVTLVVRANGFSEVRRTITPGD